MLSLAPVNDVNSTECQGDIKKLEKKNLQSISDDMICITVSTASKIVIRLRPYWNWYFYLKILYCCLFLVNYNWGFYIFFGEL